MLPSHRAGLTRTLLALVSGVAALSASPAHAFPTMIRHGYRACAQCHVDPSGGGALTDYGRAQAYILVAQQWGDSAGEEPGKKADFVYGAVPLPEPLTVQFDLRSILIPEPGNLRYILMQADLRAAIDVGPLVAYASAGPVSAGAQGAWLTSSDNGWNLVSREYWVGAVPAKNVLVRAGRMDLPFGIRTENHILFTRSATRTNINDDQQVGVAGSYAGKKVRAEVMGIAGNVQVAPDDFRERGYSAYAAYAPMKTAEFGVSSLLTHANADVETLMERTRQAHGVFGRVAPTMSVAVMAEADLLLSAETAPGTTTPVDSTGLAGSLEVDWEPVQGVHARAQGEYCDTNFDDETDGVTRYGGALQWFFMPRLDVRADALYGTLNCTPGVDPSFLGLVQFHYFL